eukprot:CAMPEP_0178953230 /NCGR_PEP_ID=MMETSP0789-20121207/8301_1 /TAXON_ID=3005 /ORGANISM="Rhizosolenia setigera, Strain CCMP 1694" /LENGTH=225 /DNA_ID=CAMNT_0020634461 /DNA_START=76 /DNA_END=753 /DNA_ORIENTATION=+
MAPVRNILLLSAAAATSAYAPASSFTNSRSAAFRPSKTFVNENFGFDFAEDQSEITPDIILGEANLKQWVGTVNDNSFLNRQYNVIRRVRELDLLKKTVDAGILAKLEKNGVDLKTLESLLPALEDAGALSLVANNQQLLINLVAPLLVEPAPILLPVVAGALDVGPAAFYGAAAAALGTEAYLAVSGAEVPFVGLPAAAVAGLLLVPVGGALGVAGAALASAKK